MPIVFKLIMYLSLCKHTYNMRWIHTWYENFLNFFDDYPLTCNEYEIKQICICTVGKNYKEIWNSNPNYNYLEVAKNVRSNLATYQFPLSPQKKNNNNRSKAFKS